MSDLKTLKDFEFKKIYTDGKRDDSFVLTSVLKQEAIKRAKAKKEVMKKYVGAKYGDAGWIAKENLKGDICFIKEFFDLTEEDLK